MALAPQIDSGRVSPHDGQSFDLASALSVITAILHIPSPATLVREKGNLVAEAGDWLRRMQKSLD